MTKFIPLIFVSLVVTTFGQNCSRDKILGQWIEVETLAGIKTNVDSLKLLIDNTSKQIGTWTFNQDGSWDHVKQNSDAKKNKRPYSFNEKSCEIILPVKRNAFADWNNLEIIYIDTRYFIYKSNNNPKGYYTSLLRRK